MQPSTFDKTRLVLSIYTQHFDWITLYDFLKRCTFSNA